VTLHESQGQRSLVALAGYITGEWIAVDGGKHRFAF